MSQTFSHLGTDKLVYEYGKPHFLYWGGVTQEPGTMYMCCQALKYAEFLAWARIKHIYAQNPCLMSLSSLLWVFLAFIISGRDASEHGCQCSGCKDCTQPRGTSQRFGEEMRTGEKQASYYFNLGCTYLSRSKINFYIILFTISALFSHIFHRILCGPESYSRPVRHNPASGAVSHFELSVSNKLAHILLLHLLVQTAS